MVLRLKTVEYAFPTDVVAVAATTRRDQPAITLFLPETTSRTFRSVVAEVNFIDNSATAVTMTAFLIGIKLGAVAFSDVTVTDTMTNTGEHQSFTFTRDVTSYFTTNFGAGTSQTCQVGTLFTVMTAQNISIKLYITYEYEEATTEVKTVRIPLASNLGALTTTLADIGSATEVPALDTFLPEASKVFRNIWFEIDCNEASAGVTTWQQGVRLDAAAENLDGIHQNALQSSRYYKRFFVQNSMVTSTTHSFQARNTSITGATSNNLSVLLCVTYEYNTSTSSTIINSVILAAQMGNQTLGNTTLSDASVETADIWIEEPTTITLVQSAVKLLYTCRASVTGIDIRIGGQATTVYTNAGFLTCGGFTIHHRFDSGSVGGSGHTIARGLNKIKVTAFSTETNDYVSNTSALVYLNYTSGKASGGVGSHNHTIVKSYLDHAADSNLRIVSATSTLPIPETDYWINSVIMRNDAIIKASGSGVIQTERFGGEENDDGWETLQTLNIPQFDSEIGVYQTWVNLRDTYRRYNGTPHTSRLDIESSRIFRLNLSVTDNLWSNIIMYVTYHNITFTKSGTASGFVGTVNGAFWRENKLEMAKTFTRSGDGAFSIVWYDDTENLHAEAVGTTSGKGRSSSGVS